MTVFWRWIRQWLPKFIGLLLGCLCLWQSSSCPVLASVHQYNETAGQVMYRSQQSLRDDSDRAWQAIFFKRMRSTEVVTLHLRLVGFPGMVDVDHTEPLRLVDDRGQIWTAQSAFGDLNFPDFPENVGEFDLATAVPLVELEAPLWLKVALQSGKVATLTVPPFVTREWRSVLNQSTAE